jgi:hypothetical protein
LLLLFVFGFWFFCFEIRSYYVAQAEASCLGLWSAEIIGVYLPMLSSFSLFYFYLFICLSVMLGLELRAYTLSHNTSPFL